MASAMARANPNQQIQKYGLNWSPVTDPLWIEMYMCQKGGQWKISSGATVGNGLEFHFKAALKLCWPQLVFHKWTDLFIEHFLTKRTVMVIGPASSGKTAMASFCCLMDYYLYPDCTSVICCSTTIEMLENRCWGELKKLHKDARSRFHWLSGHLIEGRRRIVTDSKHDVVEGRDFRNGLQGIPCFPSGTLIDTPLGKRAIESLKVGDEVFNACGVGRITETHNRSTKRLVRFTLSDKRSIDCTEEHPILTQRGWVKAVELETFDMVFSVCETMSILRKGHGGPLPQSQVLLGKVRPISASSSLQTMRQAFSSSQAFLQFWGSKVLLPHLCGPVGSATSGLCKDKNSQVPPLRQADGWGSFLYEVLLCEMSEAAKANAVRAMREGVYFHNRQAQIAALKVLRDCLPSQSDREKECSPPCKADNRRIGGLEFVSRLNSPFSCQDGTAPDEQQRTLVSARHSVSENKASRGDRWRCASDTAKGVERRETHKDFGRTWVVRVEVLESRSDGRFNESQGGYTVHNIEVEGHPSYSVNGVVVHNCKKGDSYVGLGDFAGIKNKRVILLGDELSLLPRVFVDAVSNLDKNPKFLCIGLGNPKDTTDALGVLAEPAAHLGGWDGGIDQSPFTKVWDIKRKEGVCLQLVGSDSPNLDGKLGIPLLTQEQIDRDVGFYGTDSLWYTMMNQGMMPRGQGSRRVLTRQECEKFGARNEPRWLNSQRTKIAFLDAAYRGVGGDRCIFGVLEYGEEMPDDEDMPTVLASALVTQPKPERAKRLIINLVDTMNVPITNDIKDLPEDQIVSFVMKQCQDRNIAPENFYFDAGMRTALVQSFSRVWANTVNSVDFGGSPSDNKVSYDIDVPCKSYYSKFVTELWFNVRHVVQAGQFRGMTDGVMQEFSSREWTIVGANKTEIEPKAKMKAKIGRSPDLADAVAVGVWGAIQKGFVIRRFQGSKQGRPDHRWKREMKEKAAGYWRAGQLTTLTN